VVLHTTASLKQAIKRNKPAPAGNRPLFRPYRNPVTTLTQLSSLHCKGGNCQYDTSITAFSSEVITQLYPLEGLAERTEKKMKSIGQDGVRPNGIPAFI
jgi:hypothetical protein